MSASRVFTLFLEDRGARLWDEAGTTLATLPPRPQEWDEALRGHLPRGAAVQLLLAGAGLALGCQDVPFLSAREARDVHLRLLAAAGTAEPRNAGRFLEPDPAADGGHLLWTASHPRREMDGWVDALQAAGARLLFAGPWQRAFLAAAPAQAEGLYLALEPAMGRLLFFQGRSLRHVRNFLLETADPAAITAIVSRELSRLVQFLRQRHRGAALTSLGVVGLPEGPAPELVAMAQELGLALANLAPDLPAFLLEGAARERKGGLDLVPEEIREARRRRVFRRVVWASVAAVALLGAGTTTLFLHHERVLGREAERAEDAAARRLTLAKEGEAAARLRFGLLRVRWAEARQKAVTEHLEQLGLRILQVPDGIELQRVEIRQLPEDPPVHRFTAEGAALTRQGFSMGTLADYYGQLAAHPQMQMEPLKEVAVVDRAAGDAREQALTNFKFEGRAP